MPGSYKSFLESYGACVGRGFSIAGLSPALKADETPYWEDVVAATARAQRANSGHLPAGYVYVSDDGSEATFYLDTARLDESGECPVVGLGPGVDVVVADSFVQFAERLAAGELEYGN